MNSIKELSLDEICLVSGGGNSGDHDRASSGTGARNSLGRNAPTHIYSDPKTVDCANAVFGGLIKGSARGPLGMAVGVAGGAIAGNCLSNGSNRSSNNNSSSGCNSNSGNCSSGGFGGTCNRP
ncbi:hypothetical protein ROM48_08100 [Cronobacter malonaticus]|uniref:hypothetical protein n=1 Tax=Cronobacter malonaticus TaxID=413503 RepID=UPI000CFDE604|nr:hypothetical protein [Cronobacter malonaticus]ELY4601552.1 hypothetical protein [Cronobacter malonaticus]MDT3535973.1 hypothetical protein [Cronobacter malonaticus]